MFCFVTPIRKYLSSISIFVDLEVIKTEQKRWTSAVDLTTDGRLHWKEYVDILVNMLVCFLAES